MSSDMQIKSVQPSKGLSYREQVYKELTLEDFALLFGTTIDDIPDDCQELIAKKDFRYEILAGAERDQTILRVLKTIDSDSLSVVGSGRKSVWEKGWAENYQNFMGKDYDINELIPKYYRPSQILRLYRDYVITCDPNFEFNFFKVFRLWLFKKYFKDADSIYEFGCGPGHNLVELAELFPARKIHGLDWSVSSRDLVNKIAEVHKYNLTGHLFDMFSPDDTLEITQNSAILTIGALEQLGCDFELFLQFLLKKPPNLCLNVEPLCELYDEDYLLDYLANKYMQKRKYLMNYLDRLKQLENDGKIEILTTQRMLFGSLYYEGWSFVLWKPKKDGEHKRICNIKS
jgi:hypothetical protein